MKITHNNDISNGHKDKTAVTMPIHVVVRGLLAVINDEFCALDIHIGDHLTAFYLKHLEPHIIARPVLYCFSQVALQSEIGTKVVVVNHLFIMLRLYNGTYNYVLLFINFKMMLNFMLF